MATKKKKNNGSKRDRSGKKKKKDPFGTVKKIYFDEINNGIHAFAVVAS